MPTLLLALLAQADALQATGVKVGEVGPDSALVWLRRTAKSAREADGAAPGAPGSVRVRAGTRPDLSDATSSGWSPVREDADFTAQLRLEGLQPDTLYHFAAEAEGAREPLRGTFRTAPRQDADREVVFAVTTCQAYRSLDTPTGFRVYGSIARLKPAFFVQAGDTVYYDNDPPLATTKAIARFHWQRMYSLPGHAAMLLEVPGFWMKDDHDLLWDDCWPGGPVDPRLEFGFEDGKRLFAEQTPTPPSPFRRVRWGRALEVWLVEGREFRSPNRAPDGPDKSIWGAEQKAWLKRSLLESDADWKVLLSPTPIVGPDRANKRDNHSNAAFRTEGDEMRRWFAANLPKNFFVVCGDRHWQYHSVDPATGVQEFGCGAVSDRHSGGSPGEDPAIHRFHRMKGGFLSVTASRESIALRHHDVDGAPVYEKSFRR